MRYPTLATLALTALFLALALPAFAAGMPETDTVQCAADTVLSDVEDMSTWSACVAAFQESQNPSATTEDVLMVTEHQCRIVREAATAKVLERGASVMLKLSFPNGAEGWTYPDSCKPAQ